MTDQSFFTLDDCDLNSFQALTQQSLSPEHLRHADDIAKNVPIYACDKLQATLADPSGRQAVLAEWAWVLGKSSGALLLRGAYKDMTVLDQATAVYNRIIAEETAAQGGKADHFAAKGANDRIWNSLQKLCDAAPEVFARYFANIPVASVCEAWLGPAYQMTAQVNVVKPGGQAQTAHRDYHLGFQTAEVAARFPGHVHDLSAVMTLQGAVAHCDMPIEAGPTKLLPFSQLFRPGYMAYRRDDFRAYFEEAFIQLPLQKGDALFFNPALFHAGGENRTQDVQRFANLLQVSSALGRAMETIDRRGMCKRLFPVLSEAGLSLAEENAVIAAAAEGYSFPTNLDNDPPVGGLAPKTQAALFREALDTNASEAEFAASLDALAQRQRA